MNLLSYHHYCLLLILVPQLATSVMRCYRTSCSDADVCVQLCPSDNYFCHAILPVNGEPQLSCVRTVSSSKPTCELRDEGSFKFCQCSTDLCNNVTGLTESVQNILGISTPEPTGPVPVQDPNKTLCVSYECSGDSCFHAYQLCDHYCSSFYTMNSEANLDLVRKGCWSLPSVGTQSCSSSCHIDNPLTSMESFLPICCCNKTLCNQNETFTHPTKHSSYGTSQCEQLNCTHSCRIINHQATCICPVGRILDSDNSCVDFNECLVNNGGCEQICMDTVGSFMCACREGFYLNQDQRTCDPDQGLRCINQLCNANNCSKLTFQHCASNPDFRSNPYCSAVVEIVDGVVKSSIKTCLSGSTPDCNGKECIGQASIAGTPHYTCCCRDDLCNFNMTINIPDVSTTLSAVTTVLTTPLPSTSANQDITELVVAIVLISVMVVVMLIIIVTIILVMVRMKKRASAEFSELPDGDYKLSSPPFFTEPPVLDRIIGQGRFATVFYARVPNKDLAIKIFNNSRQAFESWKKEKSIYSTPMLEHENILRYLGSDEQVHNGKDTYWLIFDYHPNGSLYDFLQHHIITLEQFCTLAESTANGIAHLHSEITDDLNVKPPIAHRDLKSKNILVKSNLTCVVSDFGLAVQFKSGEPPVDINGQVGTSRYMAPEVLEGSIYFGQDSIIRIDLYALGLILWEMMSRCKVNDYPVGDYHPPFYGMVSTNPSIEEMRRTVAVDQKRPEIPEGFRQTESCSRIVDTVNESWDPDADARLNAKAILGRLQTFRQELNLPSELSKESGFLSSGQSLSSPLNNRPAPASPSCDSSVTLSPSEIKPAACYLTSPNMGFSAPPNMDLCDMPQGGSASSGEREHRRAPLSGGLHCSAPLSSDEDQPPPYQQLAPLSHEPKQLNRAFLPKEIETTI